MTLKFPSVSSVPGSHPRCRKLPKLCGNQLPFQENTVHVLAPMGVGSLGVVLPSAECRWILHCISGPKTEIPPVGPMLVYKGYRGEHDYSYQPLVNYLLPGKSQRAQGQRPQNRKSNDLRKQEGDSVVTTKMMIHSVCLVPGTPPRASGLVMD